MKTTLNNLIEKYGRTKVLTGAAVIDVLILISCVIITYKLLNPS